MLITGCHNILGQRPASFFSKDLSIIDNIISIVGILTLPSFKRKENWKHSVTKAHHGILTPFYLTSYN